MKQAAETGHNFREDDLVILDTDDNWRTRGMRESAYIKALNPSLNRQSDKADRYTLPATYDSIRKAAIKAPPHPLPHQPTENKFFSGDRLQGRQRRVIENEPTATIEIATNDPNPNNDNQATQASSHHMVTRRRARVPAGDGDAPH